MKENLVKPDVKIEWEGHHPEETSPQVPRTAEEQANGSPQSVITTRRHVRTITTTGHITETLADDPESPIPSPEDKNRKILQQHIVHDTQQEHQDVHYQEQQHQQQHQQQHYIHLPPVDSPGERSVEQQQHQVVFTTANGEELQVESHNADEQAIELAVKDQPR